MNALEIRKIASPPLSDATVDELSAVAGGAASCGCPAPSGGNRSLWNEATKTGVIFGDGFIYYQTAGGKGQYVG